MKSSDIDIKKAVSDKLSLIQENVRKEFESARGREAQLSLICRLVSDVRHQLAHHKRLLPSQLSASATVTGHISSLIKPIKTSRSQRQSDPYLPRAAAAARNGTPGHFPFAGTSRILSVLQSSRENLIGSPKSEFNDEFLPGTRIPQEGDKKAFRVPAKKSTLSHVKRNESNVYSENAAHLVRSAPLRTGVGQVATKKSSLPAASSKDLPVRQSRVRTVMLTPQPEQAGDNRSVKFSDRKREKAAETNIPVRPNSRSGQQQEKKTASLTAGKSASNTHVALKTELLQSRKDLEKTIEDSKEMVRTAEAMTANNSDVLPKGYSQVRTGESGNYSCTFEKLPEDNQAEDSITDTANPCNDQSAAHQEGQVVTKGLPKADFQLQKPPVVKYFTDQGFRPLLCAFRNMNWKDFANKGRWNMFWGNVMNARALYQPGQRHYFSDDQLVNHFPSCYQLSRKDNMTKNIKKYRHEMHNAKDPIARKDRHGNFLYLDLIAPTYLLPFDFNSFVDEFKKHGGLWIVKPCNGSQGQGIFLVNQLEQAKRWQEKALAEVAVCVADNDPYQGFLISRYIANPLLINGKKFDLRLYVLVTCFRPLRCYYYRQGFCRFCSTKYSPGSATLDDKFMHLTNVAVQKHKKDYNRSHGNKWNINSFRLYMERAYGRGKTDALFDKIFWMIVQSLKAAQPLMDTERHCYEMYGYDCLIDAHLKPWLLEINASPSLEDSTPLDRVNKTNLLMDTMKMAMYERCPQLLGIKEKMSDASDMPLGDYEVLYLEALPQKVSPAEKSKKAMGRYGPSYGNTVVPAQTGAGVQEKPRWNI